MKSRKVPAEPGRLFQQHARHGTGDPALRWEVARVWRLGRQVSYVIVSAQKN